MEGVSSWVGACRDTCAPGDALDRPVENLAFPIGDGVGQDL